MGKLLEFLFGRSPQIFDSEGRVVHQLPNERWQAWQSRYLHNPEYNWRNHTGMRAKAQSHDRQPTKRF